MKLFNKKATAGNTPPASIDTDNDRKSILVALLMFCVLVLVAAFGTFSSYQASASVSDEQTNPGVSTPAKKSSFKVDKSDSSTTGDKKTSDTSKDDKSSDSKSAETKGASSDSESSDSGENGSHDSTATSGDSSSSSSSGSSDSGSTSSSSNSSASGSAPTSSASSSSSSAPAAHVHNWVEKHHTQQVNHPVWVVDTPAHDEPIRELLSYCNWCGQLRDSSHNDDKCIEEAYAAGKGSLSGSHEIYKIVGYNHIPETGHYEDNWVTENVDTYYECSDCGAIQ